MPSTYSANLRLELIAAGEQANTWGNTTNTNLGTLLENAITGYVSLTTMGDADYTLIALNGANDQARQMYINVPSSASLSATRSIIAPSVPKQYIISNNSSGGQSVRIKTASSTTTCLIPNGQTKLVVCDGTNFIEGVTAANSLLLAANPTLALQAATKQYVDNADALKLNLTGGTLTGALNLPASAPTGNNATSYDYVNTNYLYKAADGPTQTMNPYLRLNYTPTNAADAVHKAYVDAQITTVTGGYLPLTGGTLTGALTLSGAPTTNLQPATKLYVDDIAAAAASTYLPLTGGTLTGDLTLAGAPVSNLQAATKLYVDSNTTNKQPLDGDLTAIAALTGGAGFLKKTGFETWALDTNSYITGNQTITLSGAVTGSGTTSITTTLADSPVVAGSYTNANITVNAKGIVTSASSGSAFALPTATDTTLGGVKVNGDTVSISSGALFLNSTNVGNALGYTACRADGQNATGVWGIDTSGSADYLQYDGSYYTANQFYLASNPSGYVTGTGGGASGTWNINILGSAAQLGGYTATQFVLDSELTTILTNYPSVTGVGASGTWGINITLNAATATAPQGGGSFITTNNIGTQTVATAGNANSLGGSSAASYLLKTDASTTYLSKADASTTYLTTSAASTTYLTTSAASTTYLTKTSAANTYLPLTGQASSAEVATYLDYTTAYTWAVPTTYAPTTDSAGIYFRTGISAARALTCVHSNNGDTGLPLLVGRTNASNTGGVAGSVIGFSYGSTIVSGASIAINSGGGSVSYNQGSDYRLKENITPLSSALPRIMGMNPVSFEYKVSPGIANEGFIAHELAAYAPSAVTGEKDEVDEEGVPKYQGVDVSKLVPMLVKAVQELKAEIDALKGA